MVLTTAPPSIQDGMSKSIAYICNLCSTLQFQSIIDLALNLYRPLLGIFHLCFKSRLLFIPTTLLLQLGKCTSQHTSIKNISLQPLNRFQYFSFIILSRSCNSNFNNRDSRSMTFLVMASLHNCTITESRSTKTDVEQSIDDSKRPDMVE